MVHSSHQNVLKRLKRASGHLNKIISMIEAERPCLEVAQQLQAVTNALANAKSTYARDHIEHCLYESTLHPKERGTMFMAIIATVTALASLAGSQANSHIHIPLPKRQIRRWSPASAGYKR